MDIYINTVNESKIKEARFLFSSLKDFKLNFLNKEIKEVLTNDIQEVIKRKAISAYCYWKLPIIVEHGALEVEFFNNFPGALSKPMWDLMGDKICKLIPNGESRKAKVISAICYCDGKNIKTFLGETHGEISVSGKGKNGFQFDPIFIPKGSLKTYAQMDIIEKMKYSQATISYRKLSDYLTK
jgi:XTP/dITP diphosphohydrolase